jgi:DNA-binding CsgD family transcriptional regulator/tetratricopeptide (TPR) repeat protein
VMMPTVPSRASSPSFIGRREQLDALRAALAGIDGDRRRVALVHGEAGIGKSRLLDEFSRSVTQDPVGDRPTLMLRGTCIELGGGELPYAPILDILDALASATDIPEDVARVRVLRDELGGVGERDPAASGRGRTFVAIRDRLVAAASAADVVVCLDDLHWADRSTLELLAFLAGRVGGGRVLFVLAYRSDEVRRGHPLRGVLAELERGGVAADIPLEPLARTDVREQLSAILGELPDASRFERIVTLADGNPFHVEELAALEADASDLPRSLRDVLLARLDRLDDATLGLLGRAAVIGRDLDERLLVIVSDRRDREVHTALRQAMDFHVLEPAPDGRRYRFRHALLREAVLVDLMPSDRMALHRQVAEALEARPELAAPSPAVAAAELAYHWSESGDVGRAFPALVDAGRRGEAAHAWAEASEAYERAATLAAAGVGSLEPIDVAELFMHAAWLADFAGDLKHGLTLGRRAVETDDERDPVRSGALLDRLGSLANDAGEFAFAESVSERAMALIPRSPPSIERAHAVANLAGRRMIVNRCLEAIELADEAIVLCRAFDAAATLGTVLAARALASSALGRVEETRTAVAESLRILDVIIDDALFEAGEIACNVPFALYVIGDFERVPVLVDDVMARAVLIGAEMGWGIWVEPSAAQAAFATGDWQNAAERIARYREYANAGFPLTDATTIEADLAAGQGDRARVEALLTHDDAPPAHRWVAGQFMRIRAVAALWDRDVVAAVAFAESSIEIMAGQEEFPSLVEILKTATRAYADLAELHRAARAPSAADAAAHRAAELADRAAAISAGTHLEGASSTPWMRAIAAQVVAEADRAAGRRDPLAWAAAAAAHEAIGTRPDVAYCRYRQGEALLGRGDAAGAVTALGAARDLARQIGITPLLLEIESLARRGRLSLDSAKVGSSGATPDVAPDPWGLTVREREVLDLLADGRTNRQIGEALFISGKTASVHVTHILDKLDVTSRTEAALLAGRRRDADSASHETP